MSNLITKSNSLIDLHSHAGSTFDKRVTLTFDLLTSGSNQAERLPCTVCLSVDNSSCFPFKARTHRPTDTQSHRQH